MADAPPAPDYMALPGPFVTEADLVIENIGDGFGDIAERFPVLAETMNCPSDHEW